MTSVQTFAMPEIGVEQWNEIKERLSRLKPVLVMPMDEEGNMLDAEGKPIPWSLLPKRVPDGQI